ncbi:hypothetical protein ACQBAU_17570 [Propionibacteriaceae bacterium Y2011]|uniref:hypothetical protein n=1 Tax=Microlunatus sp. Y2014 TaxID=3418488 RepID=UPI003B4E9086
MSTRPYESPQDPMPVEPGPDTYGQLVLHLAGPVALFGTSAWEPAVTIDDFPARVHWGTNTINAPVGRRRIEIQCQHPIHPYGRASWVAEVHPGRRTEVFYAAPHSYYAPGAVGDEPQKRAGRWHVLLPLYVGAGSLVAVVLGFVLLALLS